jgi:hypothetical protein
MTNIARIVVCLALVGLPTAATAQIVENVGTRAQGMGGAFVAVADDATATWWNPAGIAAGPYFDMLFEYDRLEARGQGVRGIAVAFPALGLSYYRLPINGIRVTPSTGSTLDSQRDPRVLSVYGMTVGQSIGKYLVLASTLKLERSAGDTAADLDVGAIGRFGVLQLGVTAKNLRKPTLTGDLEPFTVDRQLRAGLALSGATKGLVNNIALAIDADVTTNATPWGDVRHAAIGAEAWTFGRKLAIRGGAAANTVGERRATASGGLSLMLTSGAYVKTYVDGAITRGQDDSRRGWSASLRATF